MSTGDSLLSLLTLYLVQTPTVLVALVGLVIALVRWKRHPRVSVLAGLGLVVLLLVTLVFTPINSLLPLALMRGGMRPDALGLLTAVRGLIQNLLTALGIALLVASAFAGRSAPAGPAAPSPAIPPVTPPEDPAGALYNSEQERFGPAEPKPERKD